MRHKLTQLIAALAFSTQPVNSCVCQLETFIFILQQR